MGKSQIKSGAVFSYLTIISNIIVGLLIAPFMLKYLGDTECSLYNMIGALVGYISVLDFGIGNAIIRYVSKYRLEKKENEQRRFLGAAILLYGGFAILVIFLGLILYPNIKYILTGNAFTQADIGKAQKMFLILIFNLAFSLLSNAFPAIMSGYGKFSFQKLITWVRTLVRFCLLILLLMHGFDSVAIVILDTSLNLIVAAIFMIYVFVYLNVKLSFHSLNFKLISEIIKYSFYIFLDMIINQIYWKLGQIILGIVSASPLEINAFAYGMTIPNYYIMISTALATMFMPTITEILTEQEPEKKLTDLLIRIGRIQLIILGLILLEFSVIGNQFITLWIGKRYSAAYVVAIIVMFAATIPCFQNIGIVILQVKNMMKFRVLCYLGVCIFNILISFLLAPKFGAIGAAVGTVISLIVGNVLIINLYYHKIIGLDMIRSYKQTLSGIAPGMLLAFATSIILVSLINGQSWIFFIMKGALTFILYFLSMWFIGLNDYEKQLIIGPLTKLLRKQVKE